MSDLEDVDTGFVAAVAALAGTQDVLLLDTWNGVDPLTFEMPEHQADAAIFIERYRRPGRFGLDISIFGQHRIEPTLSEAEFVRRLAHALCRSFVISDCDANPWSWFRIDPNGAIYQVYTCPDGEDGAILYDLACDLEPNHPDYIAQRRVWPAGEPLPQKPADAPDHLPRDMRTFCQGADTGGLCESFWAPCPKLRRRGAG